MNMKALPLALAVVAAIAAPAFAQPSTAPRDCGALPSTFAGVAFAGDGDTIYGVDYKPPIRLWGLQAPELRDATKGESTAGMRTRAALEDLLAASGWKVACTPRKWDRYCRVVASCTAGNVDVSLALIREGLAYGFYLSDIAPADVATSIAYAQAEADARKAKRGLWPQWLGEK